MGVDVTAWAVVGKEFRNQKEAEEFLISLGYDPEVCFDDGDVDGWDIEVVDGYSRDSEYILGKHLTYSEDAADTSTQILEIRDSFIKKFKEIPSFIVTAHWW